MLRKRNPQKPTKDAIRTAAGKTVPDVIAPGLSVLFCGINPGLYSAAVGHHFARPGNRFWPALHAAGFTDYLLFPSDAAELLKQGYGITNIVSRATARGDELSPTELVGGAAHLAEKVQRYRPRVVAVLGIGAYRLGFNRPKGVVGCQKEAIGDALLWVLPNPSGLNAHYQLEDLTRLFRTLRITVVDGKVQYADETNGESPTSLKRGGAMDRDFWNDEYEKDANQCSCRGSTSR